MSTTNRKKNKRARRPRPGGTEGGGWPEGLRCLRPLDGSTGVWQAADAEGTLLVVKRGADRGHVAEECAADAAYRALGVPVPAGGLRRAKSGRTFKVAAFVPGPTLRELALADRPETEGALSEVREGFAADALLANWDVVGDLSNLVLGRDGEVYRVDNGGALRRRAMGEPKPRAAFTEVVGELYTMRGPGLNPAAAFVFSDLTDAEISHQILERIVPRREPVLEALKPPVRDTIEQRITYMEAWAS